MKTTHTYPTHPQDYHLPEFIDLAPLEAAYRGLCVLFGLLLDQGRHGRLTTVSRQIHKAVKTYIQAAQSNARAQRKLDMLANPKWRARVLRELGGLKALGRWERIMAKRRKIAQALVSGKPFGDVPKKYPSRAQIIARAANLKKAKQALFQKRCRMTPKRRSFEIPNPKTLVDRVKVDQEGEFRLAALKRVPKLKSSKSKEPRSKETASKPKGPKVYYTQIDPIEVYPAEFRAAEMLEPEEVPDIPSPAFIAFMREEGTQVTSQSRHGGPPSLEKPP